MARALLRYVITDSSGAAIQNAAVHVYRPGTTSAPFGTMYAAETGATTRSNPLVSNARGEISAWLDTSQVVDLLVTSNSGGAYVTGNSSQTRAFESFTLEDLPVRSASSTTVATAATPSSLAVENHDTSRHTFTVQGDNGDGNGTVEWFAIENSDPGPNDMNIRNVVVNVGDTSGSVQKNATHVTFNWQAKTGASGQYVRFFAPNSTENVALYIGVNGDIVSQVYGFASNAFTLQAYNEAQPRFRISDVGALTFGAGGATAVDVSLSRSAANVLSLGSDDAIKTGAAVHASLPAATGYAAGAQFYCTTDKQPLWSDGTNWYEADGTAH